MSVFCPPHEVEQALANPLPKEKGVRVLFPLLGERARVRVRNCTLINPRS